MGSVQSRWSKRHVKVFYKGEKTTTIEIITVIILGVLLVIIVTHLSKFNCLQYVFTLCFLFRGVHGNTTFEYVDTLYYMF